MKGFPVSALLSPLEPRPNRSRVSAGASSRFFYIVDGIGKLHEPTQTQLDFLASAYRGTGEFLADCDEFKGLLDEIHPHGSRELGTLIRPIDRDRDGFDIDLCAMLRPEAMRVYGGDEGPARLLDAFRKVMQVYSRRYGVGITTCSRCVTLEYAGGMTADITPIISRPSNLGLYGSTMGLIPDREFRKYDITNPRGYARAFSAAASISPLFRSMVLEKAFDARADVTPLSDPGEVFPRLLSRLVQLTKLHRNVSFGPSTSGMDLRPTSIFLTSLAAAAYTDQAPRTHDSPLELLLDMLDALDNYVVITHLPGGAEHWHLENPSAPGDNLAHTMNAPGRQEAFRQWLDQARRDIHALVQAIEERQGMDQVLKCVESAFGDRAAHAVRDKQEQNVRSDRSSNRVVLVTGAAAAAVSVPARAHTYFGE